MVGWRRCGWEGGGGEEVEVRLGGWPELGLRSSRGRRSRCPVVQVLREVAGAAE